MRHGHAPESLLGETTPDHARATAPASLRVAAVWLALWLIPVVALSRLSAAGNVFSQIAVFFSKMAVVTFGGAYAVLAYVAQQAVSTYGWLSPARCWTASAWRRRRPGL